MHNPNSLTALATTQATDGNLFESKNCLSTAMTANGNSSCAAPFLYKIRKAYIRALETSNFTSNRLKTITEVKVTKQIQFEDGLAYTYELNPTKQIENIFVGIQLAKTLLQVASQAIYALYETLNLDVSYRWNDSNESLLGSKQLKSQAFTNYQ